MPYVQMNMSDYYGDEENGVYGLPIKLIHEPAFKLNQHILSTKKKVQKVVKNNVTNKSNIE